MLQVHSAGSIREFDEIAIVEVLTENVEMIARLRHGGG